MTLQPEQLVAHRGYQQHFPENTLIGIQAAVDAGALFIEVDIQLSQDHIPMLYHDDTLLRGSGKKGIIFDYNKAELLQFPHHEPQRFGEKFLLETIQPLSSLEPIICQNPNVTFYIELKEASINHFQALVCLKQIQQSLGFETLQQCCLISFDIKTLQQAQSLGFKRIGTVLRDWGKRHSIAKQLNTEVLFINKTRLPQKGPLKASCPVVVYEVADQTEAQELLARGIDKIETFDIGRMLQPQHAPVPEKAC